jgi:large subunit ribosomal protein L28
MSRVCSVCDKGRTSGNNVSHSNRRTRRTFGANVQKVRVVSGGIVFLEYVCARCLKSGKVERA